MLSPIISFSQCQQFLTVFLDSECNDNGTINDPSDDTFTATVFISNDTNPTGTFTSSDGSYTNEAYGSFIYDFGPFPISGGDVPITILDDQFACPGGTVVLEAPGTCSNTPVLCVDWNSCISLISSDGCTHTFLISVDEFDDPTFSYEVTDLLMTFNLSGLGTIESIDYAINNGYYALNNVALSNNGSSVSINYNSTIGSSLIGERLQIPAAIVKVSTPEPTCITMNRGLNALINASDNLCSVTGNCMPVEACSEGETISGLITSFSAATSSCEETENLGIEGANVTIVGANGASCQAFSENDGGYECELCKAEPYEICVETICEEPCGLSELDLIDFREYILGIQECDLLTAIFGDIDQSGNVSTLDLVFARMEILGIDNPVNNWCRFMPVEDYDALEDMNIDDWCRSGNHNDDLANTDNCLEYDPNDPNQINPDFIRFALGDMNGSCSDCIHGDEMGDFPIIVEDDGSTLNVRLIEEDNVHIYTLNIDVEEGLEILSIESRLHDVEYAILDNVLKVIAIPSAEQEEGVLVKTNENMLVIEYSGEIQGLSSDNNYILAEQSGRNRMTFTNKEYLSIPQTEIIINNINKFNLNGSAADATVELYDMTGRLYQSKKIDTDLSTNITIRTPEQNGIYLIRVYNEQNDITKKVFLTNQP